MGQLNCWLPNHWHFAAWPEQSSISLLETVPQAVNLDDDTGNNPGCRRVPDSGILGRDGRVGRVDCEAHGRRIEGEPAAEPRLIGNQPS